MNKVKLKTSRQTILGMILHQIRIDAKVPLIHMADILSVREHTYTSIELGEYGIRATQLLIVEEDLGLDPGELLEFAMATDATFTELKWTVAKEGLSSLKDDLLWMGYHRSKDLEISHEQLTENSNAMFETNEPPENIKDGPFTRALYGAQLILNEEKAA